MTPQAHSEMLLPCMCRTSGTHHKSCPAAYRVDVALALTRKDRDLDRLRTVADDLVAAVRLAGGSDAARVYEHRLTRCEPTAEQGVLI